MSTEKAKKIGRSRFLLIVLFLFLSFLVKEKVHAYPVIESDIFTFVDMGTFVGLGDPFEYYSNNPNGNWNFIYSSDNIAGGADYFPSVATALADAQLACDLSETGGSTNSNTISFPPNGFVITTSSVGYYWWAVTLAGAERCLVGVMYYDGIDLESESEFSETTRIDTFTYSTSTRIANVTGYWNTHASSTEKLSFWQDSQNLGQESFQSVTASSSGPFNFSFEFSGLPTPATGGPTTTVPIYSPYTLNARIQEHFNDFNGFTGEGTPPRTLAATSTLVTTLTYGLDDFSTGGGLFGLPEYECSITAITGCLKNAFLWLFYPASDTLEKFETISYESKFPFVYVFQIQNIRNSLFSASSTAETAITIPIWKFPGQATSTITILSQEMIEDVPFSGTIYLILQAMIWFMMAGFIYNRVLKMHDTHTP